jgi:hypothetical protein
MVIKYTRIFKNLFIFLTVVLNVLIIIEAQPINSISENYAADCTKEKQGQQTGTLRSTRIKQPTILYDSLKPIINCPADDFIFQKSNIKIVL